LTDPTQAAQAYFDATQRIINQLRETQMDAMTQAAAQCAETIAGDGLVHLFGTGHSRIPIEEMFPRHGSFPGFHPIVELSMTHHTQVVGANGQRQAMFIERMEGLGEVILKNFEFYANDCIIIFSNSGVNAVVLDVALGAKQRGLPVIGVVSMAHSLASTPKHSSGKRLSDIADITIDNCVPQGDALVEIDGLEYPVGPGSTIAYGFIVNTMKSMIAAELVQRGKPPLVLTSSTLIGSEASAALFERTYDDYRYRIARAYARREDQAGGQE
jgi:uncharacterized phosphosugar-binding protein